MVVFNLIEPSVEELPQVMPPTTVASINTVLLPSRRRVLENAAKTNCTVTVIKIMIIPMEISHCIFFLISYKNINTFLPFSQEVVKV